MHIVATITLNATVAFDTVFVFALPALLISSPMMWCKEHL
jgi:hypothetical protein